jgi:hypothetical protein
MSFTDSPEDFLDPNTRRTVDFITDIQKLRESGETISSSQLDALEAAYRAKGGNDLSLIESMGEDGNRFLEAQMDKLRYGSDMKLPSDAPPTFYDIDLNRSDFMKYKFDPMDYKGGVAAPYRGSVDEFSLTLGDDFVSQAEPFKTERLW